MATTPTSITVRVIAKDGKFLGADIGGSLVTIRDVMTGELLAKGYTTGDSGNTTEIMNTPRSVATSIRSTELARGALRAWLPPFASEFCALIARRLPPPGPRPGSARTPPAPSDPVRRRRTCRRPPSRASRRRS